MVKTFLPVIALLFVHGAFAQIKFEESYGGSKSDMGRDVLAVGNGYVIAGSSMNATNGEYDMLLMKTDPLGVQIWSSTFGDVNCEQGFALAQLSGGGFVIVGSALQAGRTDQDIMVVRTDANGVEIWTHYYGSDQFDEHGRGVVITSGGDIVVCGYTNSTNDGRNDALTMKVDASGTVLWEQVYPMPGDQEAMGIASTSNGFALTGRLVDPFKGDEFLYMGCNNSGVLQWNYMLGDTTGNEIGRSVISTSDNSILMCGHTNSYGMMDQNSTIIDQVYVVKTNLNGDTIWTATVGDTLSYRQGFGITEVFDGYIVSGQFRTLGEPTQKGYWLKLDFNGNFVWDHLYDESTLDPLHNVRSTNDGGCVMTGFTFGPNSYEVLLIKTDVFGNSD